MKRLFFVITMLFVAVASATISAQAPKPVSWRISVKMTSQTEGKVTFKAILQPGWHLYGTQLPKNGPKPTVFNMANSEGVAFSSELKPSIAPIKVHDTMFDLDLTWWDANVSFSRTFKVTDPAKAKIVCNISFMSCNNETCSPPQTITLNKVIK